MRQRRIKHVALALCLAGYVGLAPGISLAERIVVHGDEWCPYNCDSQENPGYLVEGARLVFKQAGHELVYNCVPWTRAVKDVEEGRIDAIVGAAKGDCPSCVFPEIAQTSANYCFYGLKGEKWRYDGISSLEKIRFGAIQNYNYLKSLDAYIQRHAKHPERVEFVAGKLAVEQNIQKVLHGRLKVLLEECAVFRHKASAMNVIDRFERLSPPLSSTLQDEYLFIAFSSKHTRSMEWSRILADGWKKLEKSGELKRLRVKYGL